MNNIFPLDLTTYCVCSVYIRECLNNEWCIVFIMAAITSAYFEGCWILKLYFIFIFGNDILLELYYASSASQVVMLDICMLLYVM